jgi:hypothetical protein
VFEQMSGKEWETWVRVHVGSSSSGGPVEITYIVNEHNANGKKGKGKERATTGSGLDVILPAFSIPVGRLQVDIESPFGTSWGLNLCPENESKNIDNPLLLSLGFEITSLQSNLEHQQTRGDHRRLRQFGLREFFYSQIRFHITPQVRRPHSPTEVPLPWPTSSKSTVTFLRGMMARAAPAVLSLVLLVLVLGMYNDLSRLRTSLLDRCGPPPPPPFGPNWGANNNVPVPSVTVTATVVSHHHHPNPTSVGTGAGTQHANSNSNSDSSDVEWDDSDWASSPRSDDNSGTSGRSAPTFVTMIDVSSPPSAKHERPERARPPPPSGGDTSAHGENNALLPLEHLPLLWPIKFELPFTKEEALEAIEHGLGVAWQILRRLYHFPLDPP